MNHILLALKRPFIWLYRFRHRCGYGVHSPFAFNLITHVIYETAPYYKYKELAAAQKELAAQKGRTWNYESVKVKRLLFRLVNYAQPGTIIDAGIPAASSLYLKAGKEGADYTSASELSELFWRAVHLSISCTCTITAVRSLWKKCCTSVSAALQKYPFL